MDKQTYQLVMITCVNAMRRAIADTACSRTVAGMVWWKDFQAFLDDNKIKYKTVTDQDEFKFGDSKPFPTVLGVIATLYIRGHALVLRIAIVDCDVPLLLSRTALKQLGASYNLEHNTMSFSKLGLDQD